MSRETSKANAFDLAKVVILEDLKSEEKTIKCVTGNIFYLECLLL